MAFQDEMGSGEQLFSSAKGERSNGNHDNVKQAHYQDIVIQRMQG
jgi:hypothetical protein